MGLFRFFKRQPSSPADLCETLIQAADQRDWKRCADLCEQHQEQIRESFPTWRKAPQAIRDDPIAVQRYVEGLMAIAQLFEQAGDRSLIASLVGALPVDPRHECIPFLGRQQQIAMKSVVAAICVRPNVHLDLPVLKPGSQLIDTTFLKL